MAVVVAALLVNGPLLGACGGAARSPSGAEPSPTPSSAAVAQPGYLEGQVHIGPLQPVERVGVPPPSPSAATCTSRGLVISVAASGAEVERVSFGPDCTYRVRLAPGGYRVELQAHGIDRATDLPRQVDIQSGQTTRLDVTIDTGIR